MEFIKNTQLKYFKVKNIWLILTWRWKQNNSSLWWESSSSKLQKVSSLIILI